MDDKLLTELTWLPALTGQVEQALRQLALRNHDNRPALEQELRELDGKIQGWRDSLAKPNLQAVVREGLESDWAAAHDRRQQVEQLLAQQVHRDLRAERIVKPADVLERLDRLAGLLTSNDPTRGNLELSLHIDRITCFPDGKVTLRTCKLGMLPDALELFVTEPATADSASAPANGDAMPRRRSRLRVDDTDDTTDLRALAEFATRTDRFVELGDEWFWIDEFRIPDGPTAWSAENAEAVFNRRQQSRLPYSKLAEEFSVTSPTIGAAIRHYLSLHPGKTDEVQLRRGGRRRRKYDVAAFAEEARALWAEGSGWSKEMLAEKNGCSVPVIDKALAYAYEQEGLTAC